jgi:hypothetical protein
MLASGTSAPLVVLIGPPNAAPSKNITSKIPRDSIRIEETGVHESAHMDFQLIDLGLAYTAIRGRWNILATYQGKTLFRGIIENPRTEIRAIYPEINLSARDIGSVLDDCIVKVYGKNGGPIERKSGENDKARIAWLFDLMGPTGPLAIDAASKVQKLDNSLPKQRFPPRLTLRQALERILGAVDDESANYYVDAAGRLHTYDDDHPESGIDAPWDIKIAHTLSGTQIGAAEFSFEWDMDSYASGYFAQAPTKALSRFYTDAHPDLDMSAPHAEGLFGKRHRYIDCPDADTSAKVRRVVRKALRDTRNPVPRGRFVVDGPRCWNGSTRFQSGQLLYVTSTQHSLNGRDGDSGPWAGSRAPQPFRIVRNAISLADEGDNLVMEIEFGGRQRHLYQPA